MKKAYSLRRLFIFILPCLGCFLIAFVIPFIMGIILSLFEWKSTLLDAKFIFFHNYATAFADEYFRHAFVFTTKFTIISVITINLFAFGLALLLTRSGKLTNIFRTVFFMPNLIGGIILGYIWQVLLNSLFYGLNQSIGSNSDLGFIGLLIVMNWQLIGYMMIIYIAGITNVNQELLDAAKVDGANYFNRLRHVIIPSVMPALTICLFLTLTNSFKLFDQNLALTAGGPNRRTEMLALNIVHTIFSERLPGVGLAKAVMFFCLIGVIALVQVRFTRRKEVEL